MEFDSVISGNIRTHTEKSEKKRGFTLVELLVVIGIMAVLMSLLIPAFASVTQSKGFTTAAYDIAGIFDQARSYAMGNNTYVFVGLLQVPDGADVLNSNGVKYSESTTAAGTLVACAIASKDGTAGFDYGDVETTWKSKYNNGKGFVMLGKVRQWEHTQLVSLPIPSDTASKMYRPDPKVGTFTAMIMADSKAISLTKFSIPLGSSIGNGKLNFQRIVTFDPQGISRVVSSGEVDAISYVMEVGLMPTHGGTMPTPPTAETVSKTNCIAVQFNAMTGTSRFYRP